MKNEQRSEAYKKDLNLEQLLNEVNGLLSDSEEVLLESVKGNLPRYPMVFIVGCARSGTTLLLQWLSQLGPFAYFSNLMSRFYKAPILAAKMHQILIDLDANGEIFGEEKEQLNFKSNMGKTIGASSPHEFWYFWKRFFAFGEIQQLSKEELDKVDGEAFKKELMGVQEVFERPMVMKAMILNWHIPYLHNLFPNSLFIHMQRNPIENMLSLQKARLRFFKNSSTWYSYKPPEFHDLKALSPEKQLAGQVHFTNAAIREGLGKIPEENRLSFEYEKFCADPKESFEQIKSKLKMLDYNLEGDYHGPGKFRKTPAESSDLLKFEEAFSYFK